MEENYYKTRTLILEKKIKKFLLNLPDFIQEFFIGIENRTTALTRFNYSFDIKIFFDYLTKTEYKKNILDLTLNDIENISPITIEKYLSYLTNYSINGKTYSCNLASKERKLSTLRSLYKYFYNKDKISKNPTLKVEMPKVREKNIVLLETDEVVKLLNTIESNNDFSKLQKKYIENTKIRDIAIVSLFLGTGMRLSELVGINKNDINFNTNSVKITRKGGAVSILYFTNEIADTLKKYIKWLEEDKNSILSKAFKSNSAFFVSLKGNRISQRAVENIVKKYAKIVSPLKKISPHKLRSTFGTNLYRATQDIYVVASVLGHKDVNTTRKHYARMSEDIKKNAVSKIKLRDQDDK